MKYYKVVRSNEIMFGNTIGGRKHIFKELGTDKYYGDQYLIDFLQDKNNSVTDNGLIEFWNSFVNSDLEKYENIRFTKDVKGLAIEEDVYSDLIIIHLRFLEPIINSIDSRYTPMDKFAMFGGNFGIFAEMTGCSFFAILNIFIFLLKVLFPLGKSLVLLVFCRESK